MTLKRTILVGALVAALTVPTMVYADTTSEESADSFFRGGMRSEQKVQMSDELKDLMEELRSGEITKDEFDAELAELDIELPERGSKGNMGGRQGKGGFGDKQDNPMRQATQDYLDGEITEDEYEALFNENLPEDATIDFDSHLQVLDLREQLKNEEITQDEFDQAIEDLGIDLPMRNNGMRDNPLRDATKDYLEGEITEAEYEALFNENLPEDSDMDFDTHLQLLSLREQLKNDELTKEEFEQAIDTLGLEVPERSMKNNSGMGQRGPRGNK